MPGAEIARSVIAPMTLTVEGEPSTAHRPRFSGRTKTGKPVMRSDEDYRGWKARCHLAARVARRAWEAEHGVEWPTDLRYVVDCMAWLRADRKDADSCARAFRDGAQGVLWNNDKACRPVIDDCDVSPDRAQPCLVVRVQAYDPETTTAGVAVTLTVREREDSVGYRCAGSTLVDQRGPRSGPRRPCRSSGTYLEEGAHWCWCHAPSKASARSAAGRRLNQRRATQRL